MFYIHIFTNIRICTFVLLSEGENFILLVLQFSTTFDERRVRYKSNAIEWDLKPKYK